MNTAILVQGGGAAGLTTAAYLSAVAKLGIKYSQIHGSSSGAINASVFHSSGPAALREVWLKIKNKDVYIDNPFTWSGLIDKRACCYDSSPLYKLLSKYIDQDSIRANKEQQFYISVTDIANERSLSINMSKVSGDLAKWVYASASPPFFFPQVTINSRKYTDGGLGELINISFAIKNGADRLIVLCPRGKSSGGASINNGVEAIKFIATMPLNYALEKELRMVEIMNSYPGKRYIEVILIRPDLDNQPDILDFDGLGTLEEREFLFSLYEKQAASILMSKLPELS